MECFPRAARAGLEMPTVPDVGALRPAIRRSAVDLPQPDGPSSDTNSPLDTSRSSGPSAVTPLSKTLVTPRKRTARPAVPELTSDKAADSATAALVLRPEIE